MQVYCIIQKEFLKILGVQSQNAVIHIIMKGKLRLRNCTENSIQWTHFMGRGVKCIFKKCATGKMFKNLDRRRLHHLNSFLEDKRLFWLRPGVLKYIYNIVIQYKALHFQRYSALFYLTQLVSYQIKTFTANTTWKEMYICIYEYSSLFKNLREMLLELTILG